jgi:hypothetical protein
VEAGRDPGRDQLLPRLFLAAQRPARRPSITTTRHSRSRGSSCSCFS